MRAREIGRVADLLAPHHDDEGLVTRAVEIAIRENLTAQEVAGLIDELERRTGRRLHSFPSRP